MLIVVISALAILVGVPAAVAVAVVAFSHVSAPIAIVALAAVVLVGILQKRRSVSTRDLNEGELLRRLSGRVSAGATLRSALADDGWEDVPPAARRMAILGQSMTDVSEALADALPVAGSAFRGICSFSEHTGASIASSLVVLADQADEEADLARQRKIALAQTKLSAIVVGVVPMIASGGLIAVRGIPDPGGAVVIIPMVIGMGLQVLGTGIVFRVASGAR
ncbi:MAG: hypothetical protein ABFR95_00585 [Actinomycetota bacterium]